MYAAAAAPVPGDDEAQMRRTERLAVGALGDDDLLVLERRRDLAERQDRRIAVPPGDQHRLPHLIVHLRGIDRAAATEHGPEQRTLEGA